MLRIQDSFSFKDPVGREYKVSEMVLALRENAKVYTVADTPNYMFVRLIGENHPPESAIRTLCDCASEDLAKNSVLWPERICYQLDNDMFCGFLAKAINISSDLTLLGQLVLPDISNTMAQTHKLTIGLNLAKCIRAIHQTPKKHVIGVPRPQDFHVSANGQVIYCNAYRCDMDSREQMNSIYIAPECRILQNNLSQESDAFSFAMMFFLLLTGLLPFGTHDAGTVYDDGQIIDMILNGESIYYYENAPQSKALIQKLHSISPDLSNLFFRAFDYCGHNRYEEHRPTIEQWIAVLEEALASLSDANL